MIFRLTDDILRPSVILDKRVDALQHSLYKTISSTAILLTIKAQETGQSVHSIVATPTRCCRSFSCTASCAASGWQPQRRNTDTTRTMEGHAGHF